jgi:putrescine:ornithine antiporter
MVAMLYSVYAIFASGKDAVLGGMIVMGIGYIIYGFIAHRFAQTMQVPVAVETAHAA